MILSGPEYVRSRSDPNAGHPLVAVNAAATVPVMSDDRVRGYDQSPACADEPGKPLAGAGKHKGHPGQTIGGDARDTRIRPGCRSQ